MSVVNYPENNEQNRERLAQLVVDSMDIDDILADYARQIEENYKENDDLFDEDAKTFDLEWHISLD